MIHRLGQKAARYFLLLAVIVAQLGLVAKHAEVAHAADNGLALKPYMGWSSYSMQVYDGPSGQWISAAKIKQMSDAMHEKLQSHGYNYINIDAGWNGGMDEYGRPIPSTTLYPDGFQNVIDYVHHNGQKIGIYLIPGLSPAAYDANLPIYGTESCHMQDIAVKPVQYADYWNIGYKIDFSNPCAQKYVDSIADLLGEWGIDFVKFDSVTPGSGHNDTSIDARGDVAAWSEALAKHHIWFELSWALDHNYASTWKKYANGWRVDWDVESYDSKVGLTQWANIARLFPDAALWWREAGPGGWNDFDSLDIGNGAMDGLTRDERQTAMTLWAASSAQLYTGNDLTRLDNYGLQLLTNDEVIAVNQAGHPVHPVSMATNQQVWYANNEDGTYTVAVFNLGTKSETIQVNWQDIGLNGSASVRDLWSHSELGTFNDGYTVEGLESHASRLFKVTMQKGTSAVNDDDTGIRYTGDWVRNGGQEAVPESQDLTVEVVNTTATNGSGGGSPSGNTDPDNPSDGPVSVAQTVYINDNDSGIVYSGAWNHHGGPGRNLGDFEDDIHYTQQDGDFFTYDFTGTGVDLITEKDASQSDIDVYIDGDLKGTAQTYSTNPRAVQQTVFSVTDLVNGPHTLKAVKKTRTSGDYMLLDALKITFPADLNSTISPTTGSFDKKSTAQQDVTTALSLNGNTLTAIRNGTTALNAGSDYTVADGRVTLKKGYLAQQPVGRISLTFTFSAGNPQTLVIDVSDTSAKRYQLINNTDSGIAYTGSWSTSTGRNLGDYKDDVQYTEKNGDYFTYLFTGTGIQLLTEKDTSQGDMDIYLDGQFMQTVSAKSSGRLSMQMLYSVTGLPNAQHSLKAVKKNGDFMLLDALKVEQPSLILPDAVIFDKASSAHSDLTVQLLGNADSFNGVSNGGKALVLDTDYSISGNQVTLKQHYLASQPVGTLHLAFGFNGDYQSDVHATGTNGDAFTYTFNGTGIEVLMPKGPLQGDFELYMDGSLMETVHAYQDNRLVQQSVYRIAGLPGGVHVLKGVKTSGEWMLVDQFVYQITGGSAGPSTPGGPTAPTSTPTPTPVPDTGDKGEPAGTHMAYIKGYEGGLFKPENSVTRAEMATMLARVVSRADSMKAASFSDVQTAFWAADAIAQVTKMDLMHGYADGTFHPNQPISRAEMAALTAALTTNGSGAGVGFTDIAGHWAEAAILKAQGAGLIQGYADGTFRPSHSLTRAEAVTILNKVLGRGPLYGVAQSPWKDVSDHYWAVHEIEEASMDHAFVPRIEGGETLNP